MLDFIRGIAVLLVLGRHYGYHGLWYKVGWAGVDLFFVLSGFLISGLIFKEYRRRGTVDLKRFWIRRGFKIYPAFYALMVFMIVDCLAIGKLPWARIFSDLLFLQDYIPSVAEHGWSLGVEEKFYFALPILLLVLMRLRKNAPDPFKAIPYLFIAISATCLALRTHAALAGHADIRPAHLRMDSLFAGVMLGYFREFRSEIFRRAGSYFSWVPVGLILLAPIVLFDLETPEMVTLGLSSTLLGFTALLLWSVNQTLPEWRWLQGIVWIGKYSYSIYLWHMIVQGKLGYAETNWGIASLPFYIAACIGVGWLAAFLVETPFLALRDKRFPAPS